MTTIIFLDYVDCVRKDNKSDTLVLMCRGNSPSSCEVEEILVDHINRILSSTEAARFAVGYFFLSGLTSIADKLKGVKEASIIGWSYGGWLAMVWVSLYPREVEEVLSAHAAVAQVTVFGVNDPLWGEAITAAVVVREGMKVTLEELTEFCKERLTGYKRPKRIYFLEDLPKNLYGKVLRKELKKRFSNFD
jgi:pimeloyl-ACP methyl ester carboxylesterase